MNNSRSTLFVFCAVFAVAASAMAAEPTWKWPNLNPFAKKDSATTSHTISDKSPDGLKLPRLNLKSPKIDLWPKWGQTKTSKPSEPSAWNKFTSGTKNFFDKTKETLASPFKSQPAKTSRYQFGRTEKPEKKSLFTGWLTGKKEEPNQRMAPHDFLKQPRPEF